MCEGSTIAAIAMTEPGAGSDLQGLRTTAIKDTDGTYLLNGALASADCRSLHSGEPIARQSQRLLIPARHSGVGALSYVALEHAFACPIRRLWPRRSSAASGLAPWNPLKAPPCSPSSAVHVPAQTRPAPPSPPRSVVFPHAFPTLLPSASPFRLQDVHHQRLDVEPGHRGGQNQPRGQGVGRHVPLPG